MTNWVNKHSLRIVVHRVHIISMHEINSCIFSFLAVFNYNAALCVLCPFSAHF